MSCPDEIREVVDKVLKASKLKRKAPSSHRGRGTSLPML